MRTITLTAHDGETLTGHLPESWDEVQLLPYTALAGATDLPGRIRALAALVGLPAEALLNEVKLYATILRAAPWLATLPPAGEPVAEFKHGGQRYVSAGHLRTLSAGQLDGLYDMQQAHADAPLLAAPGILAVLYWPAKKPHTPELHKATTEAFATLPVSLAWPALVDFMRSGLAAAHSISSFLAVAAQVNQGLDSLETALRSSDSTTFWRRPLRWILRRWIASVRKTASMS